MVSNKTPAKVRGVYEREPGSGIWWIRYEVEGKPKREKVGRRSDAIALYQKRKADLRIGLKLPDNLRQRAVNVGELGRDAIQWYKDHSKRDLYTFSNRMELIIRELGSRSTDSLKPKEIEDWLACHTEWSPATKNRYKTVLSKAFQLALKSDRVTRNPARLVERRSEGDGRIRYLRTECCPIATKARYTSKHVSTRRISYSFPKVQMTSQHGLWHHRPNQLLKGSAISFQRLAFRLRHRNLLQQFQIVGVCLKRLSFR